MRIVAVDIGITGALAWVDHRGESRVHDLPTLTVKGARMVRRRLDPCGLRDLVREAAPAGEAAVAVIEDVHTMPGAMNSPQSQGSLMHSLGVVQTVLELQRLQVWSVQPATWKRFFGLLRKDKAASLPVARVLYPALDDRLRRKLDHNRADAVLLAHYGLRLWRGDDQVEQTASAPTAAPSDELLGAF